MLKADFHLHTKYSINKDCDTPLEAIIARCQKLGINCIAVTDHGTAEGGLEMQKIAPFKVIVGEEILTPNGEIMGLFLKETIPSGISVEEAVAKIKAQGGLVCLPHPFDPLRGLRMRKEKLAWLVEQADIIEVFNARGPFPGPVKKANALALKYNLPGSAGSDAHYPYEIGHTYIEMPEFNGKEGFLQALRKGTIRKQRASLAIYVRVTWARLVRAVTRKKGPPDKPKHS
ncbi:MAG TPA: PHP domain-containing protein [Dehalococcoidales bacterium]|nr:PHP domain-containing protein [Dehalococcoidales bacterium]